MDNPIATSPQDQPAVNEHATLARACSSRQNAWNNTTEAAEFVSPHRQSIPRAVSIGWTMNLTSARSGLLCATLLRSLATGTGAFLSISSDMALSCFGREGMKFMQCLSPRSDPRDARLLPVLRA
jgi:hypothetical protein